LSYIRRNKKEVPQDCYFFTITKLDSYIITNFGRVIKVYGEIIIKIYLGMVLPLLILIIALF